MTFKYGLTLPGSGGNKLPRFKSWASETLPDLEYRLPPQAPIRSTSLTIRLRSLADRERVLAAFPETLP